MGNLENNYSKKEIDPYKIMRSAVKLINDGNEKEGFYFYEIFLKHETKDSKLICDFGTLLHQLGYSNKANQLYQKAILIDDSLPHLHSNIGLIQREQGLLLEAEQSTRKAIKINPEFVDAYCNLGLILRELGKYEEAEFCTRKALELNSYFDKAYFNLGIILNDLKKPLEAEIEIRKAIYIQPNVISYHKVLSEILFSEGDLQSVEICLKKIIELNPNYHEVYSNLSIVLVDQGKINEAEEYTRTAIKLNEFNHQAFYNLGVILSIRGNYSEAKEACKKAIKIDPNNAEYLASLSLIYKNQGNLYEAEKHIKESLILKPHSPEANVNFGSILKDLGNLKSAEELFLKALSINKNLTKAYYNLSTLKSSSLSKELINHLFSEEIKKNLKKKELIDLNFAKANFLSQKKEFLESAECLKIANSLKLELFPSDSDKLINLSNGLFKESKKLKKFISRREKDTTNIFIVGMPRSGSTLVESIISMNKEVTDLGEVNIFEDSYKHWHSNDKKISLLEIYESKVNSLKNYSRINTNKWLHNYFYAGIISTQLSNAKIVYTFRNPLDNILSIFKANFSSNIRYSSSLEDCAKIYYEHIILMEKYKKNYPKNIFSLNYDVLVKDPEKQVKDLINWLGWEWDELYLYPELNKRSVNTASNVQVRYPINKKSVGGWKNYKKMLGPSIKYLRNKQIDLSFMDN